MEEYRNTLICSSSRLILAFFNCSIVNRLDRRLMRAGWVRICFTGSNFSTEKHLKWRREIFLKEIFDLVSVNRQRKYGISLDDIRNQWDVMMIEFDRFSFFPSDVCIWCISNLDFALVSIDHRYILYISFSNYVHLSTKTNKEWMNQQGRWLLLVWCWPCWNSILRDFYPKLFSSTHEEHCLWFDNH